MIQDRLRQVSEKIENICTRLGKNAQDVTLVGVTKFANADQIVEAVKAGLSHVGENKVQQAEEKFPLLNQSNLSVTKHLIGHLQSNKAKRAVELFDMIESIDGFKLACEIDKHAGQMQKNMNVLIQVNTSGEEQKFGVAPSELVELIDSLKNLENLTIEGLMTIAPLTEEQDVIRKCFKDLKDLYDKLSHDFNLSQTVNMKYLSMGMSGDFEIALEEGSNMLRVGSAIFG